MKEWILREPIPVKALKELENQPELIRDILFYKGIETGEEAERFLNHDYEKDIHDPFKILNMEKAVDRILLAIKNNERIIVFGDYDADGVSASVILHEFFKKIGFENFSVYIPDRLTDGYGLSLDAIDDFIKDKVNLMITFDCGITDYEEVEKANTGGIDVIITDHHLVPTFPADGETERPPNAFTIIDSKQKADPYPFKFLCGAGVAFKIVQALIIKGNEAEQFDIMPGWEKWLLDLLAIATVADMVPLVDENRTIVHYGLKVLAKTKRTGLHAFFKRLQLNPAHLAEDDIAFMIAPRINIASRLDHANTSFALLTTDSPDEARFIAGKLEMMNNDRKKAVGDILDEIDKRIGVGGELPDVIAESDMSWHPGVLGIAANRLLEKYERPVFLWGKAEAKQIKGSCRSGGSVNLVDLMNALPKGILTEKGGHALAAGFAVADDKDSELKDALLECYKKFPIQKTETGVLHIDKELMLDDINWGNWEILEKLSPFGIENPKPIFMLSGIEIANVRKFGDGGIHAGLDFKNSKGKKVSAIAFFTGNSEKFDLKAGQKIDLAVSLEKSFFAGRIELRLKIIDIKKA